MRCRAPCLTIPSTAARSRPTYNSDGGQYNVGLVHVYSYYSETTTDTGGVAVKGYKQYDKIKQGRDGSEIKTRKYEYTEQSAAVELPAMSPAVRVLPAAVRARRWK